MLINFPSIGISETFQTYQLSDGSLVNVEFLDTAGQERYRTLNNQYYRKADSCLLVYDISNKISFQSIKNYYKREIKEKCKDDIKIILLGNKTDLEDQREVSSIEGADFAFENNYIFMETSCLENRNVADSFETLIELSYEKALKRRKESISEKSSFYITKANDCDYCTCPCCRFFMKSNLIKY